MTVRAFITSDILDCATGALSTNTFGTQAIIVKRGGTGAWHTFLALHTSGGGALTQFAYSSADVAVLWANDNPITGPTAPGTTVWGLVIVRKASGSAIPRFSIYNFTTATWTHANGSSTQSNWTAPGASGTVRFRWQSFDNFAGRVAVRAAWNGLPWTVDASGDAAIEAAGLEDNLQNWVDAAPSALWAFNQDAVTDAVTDLTGGGANQTSRTGTTVIVGDDPPGFSFAGGPGPNEGTLSGDLPTIDGTLTALGLSSAVLDGPLPALSAALTGAALANGELAGTLPTLGGGLAGSALAAAELAGTLPTLAGALVGLVPDEPTGVFDGDLPTLTGVITGSSVISVFLVNGLPSLTGTLTGVVQVPGGGLLFGTLPTILMMNAAGRRRMKEMQHQRDTTVEFIDARPVWIALVPRPLVRTASGASSYVDGAPRPIQKFRLIEMSHTERPVPSPTANSGVQRRYDYTLLAEWDAVIEPNDWWTDSYGQTWRVDSLVSHNGYETKAMITSYGGDPHGT